MRAAHNDIGKSVQGRGTAGSRRTDQVRGDRPTEQLETPVIDDQQPRRTATGGGGAASRGVLGARPGCKPLAPTLGERDRCGLDRDAHVIACGIALGIEVPGSDRNRAEHDCEKGGEEREEDTPREPGAEGVAGRARHRIADSMSS